MDNQKTSILDMHTRKGVLLSLCEDDNFFYVQWRELSRGWREITRTKNIEDAHKAFCECVALCFRQGDTIPEDKK